MSDNVTSFPAKPEPPELLIGPFEEYRVIVDGRVMPLLTGFREGDAYWLVVDHRFACGPFPDQETARQAAICAGQAMAVTAGYSHLGAATKEQPFAAQAMRMGAPA